VARSEEGNAFTDVYRNDVHDDFVEFAFIEQSTGNAATYDPDVLAFFRAQPAHDGSGMFMHETDLRTRHFLQRAREDEVLLTGISVAHAVADGEVIRFASHQTGIDGTIELPHAIHMLGARAVEEVHRTVRASDETIGAAGHTVDDFARHRRDGDSLHR